MHPIEAQSLLVMLLARDGRVFQNLQEVREGGRHFVDTNNRERLVQKNGFKSSWQARA